MIISNIDNLIDKIIDDFYFSEITKKTIQKDIDKNPNFSKSIDNILGQIDEYDKKINKTEIINLVGEGENTITVQNTIIKYIGFYLFITIFINYAGTTKQYLNNLFEITRNKENNKIKIHNFFTSESNSIIIKLNKFVTDIIKLLNSDKKQLQTLSTDNNYIPVFRYLNNIGNEIINKYFKSDDQNKNCHNIIKTVIINEIYKKHDKTPLNLILEQASNSKTEFTYIDIIISKNTNITLDAIDKVLTIKEKKNNVLDILNTILEKETNITTIISKTLDINKKINNLISSNILVPIVNDFLLYHKDNEKYDSQTFKMNSHDKKLSVTKVKYIVDKVNMVEKYNNTETEREKEKIDKLWYIPNLYYQTILINYNENINIINKIKTNEMLGSVNEYYKDIIDISYYPYINFKDQTDYYVRTNLEKSITTLRKPYKTLLSYHTSAKSRPIDIIGFLIKPESVSLECIKNNNNYVNTYNDFLNSLNEIILKNKTNFNPFIWLFNLDNDKIKHNTYEQMTTKMDVTRHMIGNLYDKIIKIVYQLIIQILNKQKTKSIQFAMKISNLIQNRFVKIPESCDLYKKLLNHIYYEKNDYIEPTINKKIQEKKQEIIHLPTSKTLNYDNNKKIKIKKTKPKTQQIVTQTEDVLYTCQHNITWNKIKLQNKNASITTDILEIFLKQYVVINENNEYFCKSCGFNINIREFEVEGNFNTITGQFIPIGYQLNLNLHELPEYSNLHRVINNIDNYIEKIALIANIQLYFGKNTKNKRYILIKNIIDVIIENNAYFLNSSKKNTLDSQNYGVVSNIGNLFQIGFELENNIYENQTESNIIANKYKKNYILTYIIIQILLELNDSHILLLRFGDKICNYQMYEEKAFNLLSLNKIVINKSGDTEQITNYNLLSYLVYYFACILSKYQIWEFDSEIQNQQKNKIFVIKIKIIIDHIIFALNTVLINYNQHTKLMDFANKFFIKLNTMFNEKFILKNTKQEKLTENKIINKLEPIDLFTNAITQNIRKTIYLNKRTRRAFTNLSKTRNSKTFDISNINDKINKMRQKIITNDIFVYLCNTKNSNFDQNFCNKIKKNELTNNLYYEFVKYLKIFYNTNRLNKLYDIIQEKHQKHDLFLQNKFKEYKNIEISNLTNLIKNIAGEKINVNLKYYDVENDIITINNDYNNNLLKQPIILFNNIFNPKNEFKIIKNFDNLSNKYEFIYSYNLNKHNVYYDISSYTLLGYKQNNEIIKIKYNSSGLNVTFSIYHQLKLLGFEHLHYLNTHIQDIFIIRHANLKNIINYIIKLFNSVFHNNIKYDPEINEFEHKLITKYYDKFKNIKKNKLFDNWEQFDLLTPTKITDTLINISSYVNVYNITDLDLNGNLIVKFLISEISDLLNINENRINKINIIHFFIELLQYVFNYYNKDSHKQLLSLKQFSYKLNSSIYVYDNTEMNYLSNAVLDNSNETGEFIDNEIQIDQNTQDAIDDAEEENELLEDFNTSDDD